MVFSPLHYIPSAIAAILTMALFWTRGRGSHRYLAAAMALSAILGLWGYLSSGELRFLPLDLHTMHSWLGLSALSSSLIALEKARLNRGKAKRHCRWGHAAALLAGASLLSGLVLLSGQLQQPPEALPESVQEAASSRLPEVEAREFQGIGLTPLSQQGNNAIKGTQYIDRLSYRLHVGGLVEKERDLSYEDILALPAYSEVVYMPCVEGWGFIAKWTGVRVTDILNLSSMKPEAMYVIFTSSDGYSTSLPLQYLQQERILLSFGINDLTLPPELGFPLQLVAKDRYGYKWAKWVTRIEAAEEDMRGYWESRGYSNSARVGEVPFG